MIKSTPNSNLLTVADSPIQQHLVSLIIYLYIYKQIQMLLDSPPAPSSRLRSFVAMVLDANAPHLTEESLDYKTVRSDRFVSTLCRPNLATWRHKVSHEAMHSHDGSYRNQPVVQYIGPIQEDGKLIVKRKTGNKVVMDIEYDPLRRRPKSLKTTLAEGQTEQNVAYAYDKKGNISSITDRLNESRSQTFEYDTLNRVTKAIGKYGTEDYSYHKNGNLLQRGQFALQYNNPNHVHAVTKVSSLQTGDTTYTYDTTGNLIERNGDVFRYNSQNKLTEITTAGGDVFQYFYDASGNRIKKQLKNANTTTYNFNNLYEIHRSPGEPEKHTMYIPGIEGDKVAQYTRSDALLVQANVNENKYATIFKDNPDQNSIFDQRRNFLEAKETLVSLFREIETDIALILFNLPKPQLLTDNYKMLPSMRVLIWLLAFGILIYYALTINTQYEQTSRRLRLATSFALFPFFFATSAGCSPLFFGGAQGEEGTPPWLLIAAVPANTPSVSDEPTFFGGGSGSGATTTNSSRITGMYFYHPDHLGSFTMITDGRGNVLAGGERGGKSHITYRPYGEILRTDSFGPDISKYKYTGQEEDRESGLMYYKARYYDSKIGRFLQSDTVIDTQNTSGMNKTMYTYGNPINYTDSSGNSTCAPKGGLVWGGRYIGPGAGGCAGTLLYSDFTDFKRAAKPTSPLFLFFLHIIAPNEVSLDSAMLYWSLNYLYNNPKDLSQSKSDEISVRHDQEFKGFPFSEKNLRANGVWIDRNVKSLFNANDWQDTYNREKNAISERKTPWGKKRGKYGDATSTVAAINTIGTRGSDLLITLGGTLLFTLGSPGLALLTIYSTNADRLRIRSNRFDFKSYRFSANEFKRRTRFKF